MTVNVVTALVVNPKTLEPCVVVSAAGQLSRNLGYSLYRWGEGKGLPPRGHPTEASYGEAQQTLSAFAPGKGFRNNQSSRRLILEGAGYLEYEGKTAEATHMARVHTPRGVKTMGWGYGTTLYSGACLTSYFNEKNPNVIFDEKVGSLGVASWSEDRSARASDWWARAAELGLAEEMVGEIEDLRAEEVNLTDLEDCLSLDDDEQMAYYNDRVEIEYAVLVKEKFDILPFENVKDHRLPLVIFDVDLETSENDEPTQAYVGGLWRSIVEDDGLAVEYFDDDAILALDVRGLPSDAINLFIAVLRAKAVDEWKIESFRLRWEMGLDPGSQSRLDAATKAQLRMFANHRNGRAAAEAVEYALELRKEMPWKRLAGLP